MALQKVWDAVLYHGGDVVSHWLFPAIVGYAAYAIGGIYFAFKDIGPWKSTETRINKESWPKLREIFRIGGIQLGIYAILNTILWYSIPHRVTLPTAAPSCCELICDLAVSMVVGDFFVYLEHICHHKIPFLYKRVHTVHHSFRKNLFAFAAGWVHPFELTIFGLCMIVYPCMLRPTHPLTFWIYECIFVALLLEEHSCHDVWWSPGHWVPAIFGGAVPHNVHHIKVTANYGFVFAIWDKIFGTFQPPSSSSKKE